MARWVMLLLAAVFSAVAHGDDAQPFELGWLLFGDLYHLPRHHLESGDGATGAVLRRGYLTLDWDGGADWFGRLRFELNQAGAFETYDFELDFKDLHVGRRLGDHRMLLGLSPTPTFDVIEGVWGHRYLMRTPMDLQGVASRDTGISFAGPVGASETWSYRAMVGAGTEFGNESGDGRKWMWALGWRPAPGWVLDLYTDFEKLSGPRDRYTVQAFVGRESDGASWGIQYSRQDRQQEPTLELASAFATVRWRERVSLVGRIDRVMEPSPEGDNISYIPFDPRSRATLFLAGLEYAPAPAVRVTPNAVYIDYDRSDDGVQPRSDFYLRLTLLLDLE